MTLTQLEYVLAVNKHRHFARAAASCFVTQPTLSMQIQKLESELGVYLFDRSKAPVVPTEEGEIVIAQAKVVLREAAKMRELLSATTEELTGEFRLGIIPTLAPYLLPLFIHEFVGQYPKLKVYIDELKTDDLIENLHKGEIDVGLAATPLKADGLTEDVLFYEPFMAYVSQDHELSKKSKIKESELRPDDVWLLDEGHCFRDQVMKICGNKKEADRNLQFQSGNLETLKNLVTQGSGYTLLPYLATINISETHRKLLRDFKEPVPTREVSLIYTRSQLKKRQLDALKASIKSHLPPALLTKPTAKIQIVEALGT